MTTIIEMAREAGGGLSCIAEPLEHPWKFSQDELERFAALVRANERAALIHYFNEHWRSDWSDGQIIEAIEARGNT